MTSPGRFRSRRLSGIYFAVAASLALTALPLLAGGVATGKSAALSTASPVATRVGLSVLQNGGNAADAAVAVGFALAVVHPQSGNLGGGGFLVYYDAETRSVWTLDFRETAPRGVTREMFASLPPTAARSALAAGIPGTVAGLDALHRKFGTRPWKELLAPAELLAREGFVVDHELAEEIARARRERDLDLFSGGEAGSRLATPELGTTLQRLAVAGGRDFYEGELAKKIVAGIQKSGGLVGHRDLRDYEPIWRAPIKLQYGTYEIYTAPPPSAGGLVIGAALNIIGKGDLPAGDFQTPAALHLIAEAQRRAHIDAVRYAADPAAARIPFRDILSPSRGEQWRKTIRADRVVGTANLTPPLTDPTQREHTTHFTIADPAGNIISLTTTLGESFGSGVFVPGAGFLLNGALNDFTSAPNALDAGKRPASPLTPAIVLRDGKPFLALGSGGGSFIPTTLLQVFLNVGFYGKSLAEAVAAPRFHHSAIPDELVVEAPLASEETLEALNSIGHGIARRETIGDVHALHFEGRHIVAVADPRHGGAAGGF